jgi:HAD superfamily hydrolase (TIGR01662 family)
VSLGVNDAPEMRRAAARWTHYYWAQSPELMEDLERYQGRDEAFWTNYSRLHLIAFGCPEQQAQELAPQLHAYMSNGYKPVDQVLPEVPDTLHALQAAGFRLAVLSNRTLPCDEYLGTLNLMSFFDFALVAGDLSCWKPDPEIFRHALKRLGLRPEETVYVGDNYYADVVGAQRAGMRPILVDPDGFFPDAVCPVIRTMGELPEVLGD